MMSFTKICPFFFLFFLPSIFAVPVHDRIVGGDFAKPGQFPYIVSVQLNLPNLTSVHYCGGSIINKQWILTAAHCVIDLYHLDVNTTFPPDVFTILTGTNLLDGNGTAYKVEKVIKHAEFELNYLHNDIGLIKIDGEIEFTDFVQSVEIGEVGGNDLSVILGWGLLNSHNEVTPNELRYLEVYALSEEVCLRLATNSFYNVKRGPGQVCIYKTFGYGTCQGDSGGPMVFHGKLVGVTSYTMNEECGGGFPDVYTRTAYYRDWIQEIMDAN